MGAVCPLCSTLLCVCWPLYFLGDCVVIVGIVIIFFSNLVKWHAVYLFCPDLASFTCWGGGVLCFRASWISAHLPFVLIPHNFQKLQPWDHTIRWWDWMNRSPRPCPRSRQRSPRGRPPERQPRRQARSPQPNPCSISKQRSAREVGVLNSACYHGHSTQRNSDPGFQQAPKPTSTVLDSKHCTKRRGRSGLSFVKCSALLTRVEGCDVP